MKKINVAVIGCGVWGRNHVRVFSDMETVNLKCISDVYEEAVVPLADKYDVEYYTDPQRIFNREDIDAVTICTPTVTHAYLAERAIRSGKHVLVEKPMTNTVDEAIKLIKLSESMGVTLTVGLIERFNPAIQQTIKYINEGRIGDVILAHTRRLSRWPVRIGDVGVIKDLAIHDIDIVNQLFGVEAIRIYANAGNIQHTFEDYANIVMSFPNHKGAFIETNWLTPRKVRTLSVTGTEGLINVDFITQTLTIETNEQIVQPFISNGEPLRLELESYIDSIINKVPPQVTGEDGLKALKICEAALESAKIGSPIMNNYDMLNQINKELL